MLKIIKYSLKSVALIMLCSFWHTHTMKKLLCCCFKPQVIVPEGISIETELKTQKKTKHKKIELIPMPVMFYPWEEYLTKFKYEKSLTRLDTLINLGYAHIAKECIATNFTNTEKESLLIQACEQNNNEAVEIFLQCNTNTECVDKEHNTPLHITTYKNGNEQIPEELKEKYKNKRIPQELWHNIYLGDIIKKQYDATQIIKIKKELLGDLYFADLFYSKKTKIAELLLEKKANPNSKNTNEETPLISLCKSKSAKPIPIQSLAKAVVVGHADNAILHIANRLIKSGANINAVDKKGNTALIYTCKYNNKKFARFLIKEKADPNIKNAKGKTALMYTCNNESDYLAKRLIKKGAHVNTEDNKNQTPLLYACKKDSYNLVLLLIKEGANLNCQDDGGYTPLMYALLYSNHRMAMSLLSGGATEERLKLCNDTPKGKKGSKSIESKLFEMNETHCIFLNAITNIQELTLEQKQIIMNNITFNHQFLLKKKFENARTFALANNISDNHGRSVIEAAAFYLTGDYKKNQKQFFTHCKNKPRPKSNEL